MAKVLFLVVGVLASAASGLVVGAPARSAGRVAEPAMSESRRSFLAAAVFLAPAAASAMTVPGLNAPGLVPATKKSGGSTPEWESFRDTSHFWSSEGIMNSVPKVKGIVTPKTPVGYGAPPKPENKK